jgi:acetyl esterase/lipase
MPNMLQHVDIWIPTRYTPDSDDHSLSSSWLPPQDTLWIIYIHGGAWRDPLETSVDLMPTLKSLSPALFESRQTPVAFASISYSLSTYPQHSTHPSAPHDYSRNARHPRHIIDVLTAISFLQQKVRFGSNYILVGHSCGATLAFQAAVNPARWGVNVDKAYRLRAPLMILGINGLYDMPKMVADPGDGYSRYCEIYEEFTRSAFGDDKQLWADISPAFVQDWAKEWPEGTHVMLVQSREDTLVPFEQAELMKNALLRSKSAQLSVELVEGRGDHYDVWKEGILLAEMLAKAIAMCGL